MKIRVNVHHRENALKHRGLLPCYSLNYDSQGKKKGVRGCKPLKRAQSHKK